MKTIWPTLLALGLLTSPVIAQEAVVGHIKVTEASIPQTGPSALFGTASLVIENTGPANDRLIEVIADFGDGAFQTKETDSSGYAKTVIVEDGVEIPAGETVTLSPEGYQIAFLNPKNRLTGGEVYTVTLRFQAAGELAIDIPVRGLGQ